MVNQYWGNVVFHLKAKPPRQSWISWLRNKVRGDEGLEDPRTWFLKRAAYFVSVVEPLNYVWH